MKNPSSPEVLLSVPPNMAELFPQLEPEHARDCFATCDPPGRPLGSGGGTIHVLQQAHETRAGCAPFPDWLNRSLKIVIHGGGQSRRLPAYAATGKLFIPVPVYRWDMGQRLDQNLLDMQLPLLRTVAKRAHATSRVMVVSGDALLRADEALSNLPEADIVFMGLWTTPEHAQHFGVFFCDKRDPGRLMTFLQKPSPEKIRDLSADYLYMIDVGLWLLSARAVDVLTRKSAGGFYDLYGEWGSHLGEHAVKDDPEIKALSTAVVPLPGGHFYHFGTNRDLIDSNHRLQNAVIDQTRMGEVGVQVHPSRFVINARVDVSFDPRVNHDLWIENSCIPEGWTLHAHHLISGIPENDWSLDLPDGRCLDMVPVGDTAYAIRLYDMDQGFKEPGTFEAEVCPVLEPDKEDPAFLQWLVDGRLDDRFAERFAACRKLSAAQMGREVNLLRLYAMRRQRLFEVLPELAGAYRRSIFYKLDLEASAMLYAESGAPIPEVPSDEIALLRVHDHMFRSAVLRARGEAGVDQQEEAAFRVLREAIVSSVLGEPVQPSRKVLDDQIVWGRSPVRLDLAGGWSDTPPYCLECGGAVINMAVDLNGQPPIQVYARLTEQPELVIRSIDLGLEERVNDYAHIGDFANLSSGFAVARAAFALCGFYPDFNGGRYGSLAEQLEAFGGGIELSMLAAVPKGSGLGTSSILAATLLGTLSEFCGLNWDHVEIIRRASVLEQLLTSGGGWQDQIGGLVHGTKLIETNPGLEQIPTIRWVPYSFFESQEMKSRMLLYYTGITRVAHNILGEIVRGLFLNRRQTIAMIRELKQNAYFCYDAILRNDAEELVEGLGRNWDLSQRLDAGTNPPAIQAILDQCGADLSACKLLGAGGGGYLLLIARDGESAARIRRLLESSPPNAKARFVEWGLSHIGFQVTRS